MDKGKNIQWRKDVSSANGNGKLETTCKSMKSEHTLTSCTTIDLKMA